MTRVLPFNRARVLALGVLVAFLTSLVGCGAPKGTISGIVSFKGKPIPAGTVIFASEDGKTLVNAQIGSDGSYKIEKCPVGNVKIAVQPFEAPAMNAAGGGPGRKDMGVNMPTGPNNELNPKGKKDSKDASQGSGILGPPPGTIFNPNDPSLKDKSVIIPAKYKDVNSTTLTYTVKSGSQTYNFEVPE